MDGVVARKEQLAAIPVAVLSAGIDYQMNPRPTTCSGFKAGIKVEDLPLSVREVLRGAAPLIDDGARGAGDERMRRKRNAEARLRSIGASDLASSAVLHSSRARCCTERKDEIGAIANLEE